MTEDANQEPESRAISRPRRFGDTEIESILKRAAELQARSGERLPGDQSGLTLDELRQIALEAGIDARFIDLAVADMNAPSDRNHDPLAGGPTRWSYQASVVGEVRDSEKDRLLQAIRSILGQRGEIAEVFGRMEWSYDDGLGPIIVGVMNREGKTEIDVTSTRSGEAGLFHGLGVPFGGILGGAGIAGALGLSGAAVLPFILGSAGLSYVGLRAFWKYRSRWWEERLGRVVERVASVAQEVAVAELTSGGDEDEGE